jgi:hypothetical protein
MIKPADAARGLCLSFRKRPFFSSYILLKNLILIMVFVLAGNVRIFLKRSLTTGGSHGV